ncbi:hypothetical protein [Sphingomonas phage Carli]|nr:hypothetical protein [Sphingomonas phage Carli]
MTTVPVVGISVEIVSDSENIMARRTTHTHAVRTIGDHTTLADCMEKRWLWGNTWCGTQNGSRLPTDLKGEDPFAYARRMTDCPGCSAAIGKARLRQIADRVKVEASPIPTTSWGKSYRSLNKVIIDGEHVGWIVMQNGWGNPWTLHQLTPDPERAYGQQISMEPSRHSETTHESPFQRVHAASRDMMASAALRCFDAGDLPTLERMAEQREARRVKAAEEARQREIDKAAWAVERERKDGLRAERKELALDWINAVLEMPDLTNSQRAGAQAALDIITGKDVQ